MLPTFDFIDFKAQGKNYCEHNIAVQKKENLVLGEAMGEQAIGRTYSLYMYIIP
jgi:hypothetical protein